MHAIVPDNDGDNNVFAVVQLIIVNICLITDYICNWQFENKTVTNFG